MINSFAQLLPELPEHTHQFWLIIIGVASMIAVCKGADWLVESAAGLAARLGIPKAIVGATIISLGTTAPEVAVSVLAAFTGNPGLAMGNGVGSIIADTGLIFGLGAMMVALPADKFVLQRQGWVQLLSALAVAAMAYGSWFMLGEEAAITRWMGIVLISGLVVYLYLSTRWSKAHPMNEPHLYEEDGQIHTDSHDEPPTKPLIMMTLGITGLVMVIIGGDAFVQSASMIAVEWGVPQAVIAGTIVALGTSMPELIVGITSIRKGHAELLVGNIIGADILNALFVIGASACAANLPLFENVGTESDPIWNGNMLWVTLPTMLAMLFLMRGYIFMACKKGRFSRWMGAPLVIGYIAYNVASYII